LASSATGGRIEALSANSSGDIDAVFANLARKQIGAFVVSPDVLFSSRREQLAALAARHALPAIAAEKVKALAAVSGTVQSSWWVATSPFITKEDFQR
jgi:hypothetical protein